MAHPSPPRLVPRRLGAAVTVLAVVAAACSPSGSPDATSTSAAVTASAANATTTAPNPAAAVTAATSTPAAAPPPATTARLGADLHDGAIDASFFGVEPIPATSDPRILDAAFGAVEELGVAHVGVNRVLWSDIEPDPPVDGVHDYDWSTLDAMADRARAIGVSLELTLQVTSPWATEPISASTGDSSFSAPVRAEHLEDYDAFVTTLVRRYNGAGPPVVSILMVGNEIEVPSHWATNGTDDNPATQAAYLDLVARTRSLVAAIDPGLVVARASTNFGPAFDDLPNAARVTERLNGRASSADLMTIVQDALGRSDTYDAFGVHPNNGVDGVEGIATFVSELLPETKLLIAEDMRSTLVSSPLEPGNWPDLNGNGLEDVVEVLDTGRAVAGLDPATATEQYRAAQSDTLVEKVVLAAASGYDTVFVSSLFDFGPGYSIVTWRYAGLVDFDTDRRQVEPRPAYHAYRELIGLLTGASPGPVTRAGETVRVDFEAPAGDFAVSWGPGSTVESADRYWRFPRFAGEETLIPLDVEEALSEPGPVVAMT